MGRDAVIQARNRAAGKDEIFVAEHSQPQVFFTAHNGRMISTRQGKQQHPLTGPLSGTTRVSQYQKGKTNLDFTEARDSEWQWHQLGRMQVCTSLQPAHDHSVFYRPDALPAAQPNQQRQNTEGISNNKKKYGFAFLWIIQKITLQLPGLCH